MQILVFNAGSSSLKFGVFDLSGGTLSEAQDLLRGTMDRFSPDGCDLKVTGQAKRRAAPRDLAQATAFVPELLAKAGLDRFDAIAHRIAHGGERFNRATRLDGATLEAIRALTPLAPLHNPANLAAVEMAQMLWPDVPQWGVFDTAFHLTNPARATTYAVPAEWRKAGLRRYGFHGTSHKYVAMRAAEALQTPLRDLRMVSLHLGNGASACAIAGGKSIDSSMGLTPLEGLVMGTRSGDVDPGIFGFLQRQMGLSVAQVEDALYRQSGLLALTGQADMREVEARAAAGDADAQLAINLYAYRARKYVGAYAAAMGGLDALVFTGGIGENSASMRRRICDGLEFLGLRLDDDRNVTVELEARAAPQIQAYGARVNVLVTQTAEQLMIAHEVAQMMRAAQPMPARRLPIAVSARHVHLDRAAVDALFGPGYDLTPARPLRQKGHWAAQERVTLEGPKGRLEHVAILGPLRPKTQIEVSRTDGFALGVDAPVRQSGDLAGSARIRLYGPAGSYDTTGLIVAARHIHMSAEDAHAWALHDGDMVDVSLDDTARGLTFTHVLVRVSANATTEMHIDTDEANAAGILGAVEGEITGDVQITARHG